MVVLCEANIAPDLNYPCSLAGEKANGVRIIFVVLFFSFSLGHYEVIQMIYLFDDRDPQSISMRNLE